MPERTDLALALRRLRRERKLSQVELAYAAGVSPSHITSIERGERNPSADALADICDALKASTAERRELEVMRQRVRRAAVLSGIEGDEERVEVRSPVAEALDRIQADDPEGFQTLAAQILHHAQLLTRSKARR